jgi:hypothetical protein
MTHRGVQRSRIGDRTLKSCRLKQAGGGRCLGMLSTRLLIMLARRAETAMDMEGSMYGLTEKTWPVTSSISRVDLRHDVQPSL